MDDEPLRVLIVEDDDAISTVLALTLVDEGYSVRQARESGEALAILRVWRPDAILLDIELPGPDGWDFRRQQLTLPDAASVPVVIVSAGRRFLPPDPDLLPAATLTKPFQLEQLLSTIGRVTARPTAQGAS